VAGECLTDEEVTNVWIPRLKRIFSTLEILSKVTSSSTASGPPSPLGKAQNRVLNLFDKSEFEKERKQKREK